MSDQSGVQYIAALVGGAATTLLWLATAAYGTAVLERFIATPSRSQRRARRAALALVQPLAAATTLLRARAPVPSRPDAALFHSAPFVALGAVALAAWVVPFGPDRVGGDSAVGVFFFLALLAPVVVALANAGWSTNGKFGVVASFRAIAHIVAYEVVLGFALLGPAMAAESLSVVRIIEAQHALWNVVWQPLGLVLYLASVMMAAYRVPFDTPFAGGELAGGVLGEYGGARLLVFRAVLAALLFLVAAVGAAVYLGGWHGPKILGWCPPEPVWMLVKSYALVAVILWVGQLVPRVGHEQMLAFAWKVVLPVSFVNLTLVGVLMLWLDL